MATRPLFWAPRAKHDLLRIWRYYSRLASPDVADRLLREIAEKAEQLREQPLIGRPRPEILPSLRSLLVHPYSIFYRATDRAVEIMRVLDERRDLAEVVKKGTD